MPKLPPWLHVPIPRGDKYHQMLTSLQGLSLATVCQEAKCPNIHECWSGPAPTATLMLMGKECTRACRFCSVATSRNPKPLDPQEPSKVATAISQWNPRPEYIVLTSVDRDDLSDFGAAHFAETVRKVKEAIPSMLVECLVGDFLGQLALADIVASAPLNVFAHNLETVERLNSVVRDRRAGYKQSLRLLEHVSTNYPDLFTKSSLMVGCGEREDEIMQALSDLRAAGVSFITVGQYVQPAKGKMRVEEYWEPQRFEAIQAQALRMGFQYAVCGPLVRSSFKAGEHYLAAVKAKKTATN